MAPPPRLPEEPDDSEAWITTFADMVTLLMAFFVLLMSISKVDMVLFEEVKSGMAKDIGKRQSETPIKDLRATIEAVVQSTEMSDVTHVGKDEDGLKITFDGDVLFAPGSAELMPAALPVLAGMGRELASPKYKNFILEVQGHTDSDPMGPGSRYPSNWELSGARAGAVIRYFSLPDFGIEKTRFKAIGLADIIPRVQNAPAGSSPEVEKMYKAMNRRIVIRLYPMKEPPKAARQMSQPAAAAPAAAP